MNNKTYKNIAHIADVHIRLASRHEEYIQVFDRLVESFKKNDIDLVVVAGDLFHSKVNLSPEAYHIATYLFDNILKSSDVVLIGGNHDANLESKGNRMDAISPFVELYNRDKQRKINYLKDTGVYHVGTNLSFYHYSVFDDEDIDLSNDEESSRIKIALFHGMIKGAKDDTGITYTETEREIPFDKFHATMLGDIHKHQELKKGVWYSGSLIQQKTSEHETEHGYIHWKVSEDKIIPTFHKIKNDWGFYTIRYENGEIISTYDIPKNASIYVVVSKNDSKHDAVKDCKDRFKTDKVYAIPEKVDDDGKEVVFQKNILDLYDYEINKQLLTEFIEDEPKELQDKILGIHNVTFKGNINKTDQKGFKPNYKIKKLSFSNTLPFGEDNHIDFTKTNGTIGLWAGNGMGKSSLADIISFSQFGSYPDMKRQSSFINNNKKKFETEVTLSRMGEEYTLKRSGTKQKSGSVSNSIEFTKMVGNKIENLGDDIPQINKKVQDLFGDLDTFIQLSYFRQRKSDSFLDMTPTKRKEWFSSNIGLEVFDILHESAKEDSKGLRHEIKYLEQSDYDNIELGIHEKMTELKTLLEKVSDEKSPLLKEIKKLEKIISEIKRVTQGVDTSLRDYTEDIEELKEELEKNKAQISSLTNYNVLDEPDIQSADELIESLRSELQSLKERDIEAEVLNKSKELKTELDDITSNGKNITKEIKNIQTSLIEFDIDVIKDNLKDLTEKKDQLNTLKDNLKDKLFTKGRLDEKLKELKSEYKKSKNDDLCDKCPLLNKSEQLKQQGIQTRNELNELENNIKDIQQKIEDLSRVEDDIQIFQKKSDEYDELLDSLKSKESDRENLLYKHKMLREKLSNLAENTKDMINNKIKSVEDNIESKKSIRSEKISNFEEKNRLKIDKLNSQGDSLKEKIKSFEEKHQKWIDQKDLIKKMSEISDYEAQIKKVQNKVKEIDEEISEIKADYKYHQKKLEENEENKKKLKKKRKEYEAYEKYIQLTHRNVLPLSVIKRMISIFESEVNFVLEKIVESRAHVYIEDDNIHVDIEDFRGKRSADRLGGTESFVFNLAFRIAVSEIGNLPMSNIMIIDEHFSVMDGTNSQNIPNLFSYLKGKYDVILVISHDPTMRDFVDNNIDIEIDGSDSKLVS